METKVTRVTAASTGSIISGAKKAGYYQSKGGGRLVCPDCGYKQVLVFHGPKKRDEVKYEKIYACTCGWRRIFPKKAKSVPVKKTCKVEGCNAIVPKGRKAYCYRCRPYKAKEGNRDNDKESGAATGVVM